MINKLILLIFFVLAIFISSSPLAAADSSATVYVITLDNVIINPITEHYITSSLHEAERMQAACFVIELNTPGGLFTSTHAIVETIIHARMPVITYISPRGTHIGSAGLAIARASSLAVMAPSTTIQTDSSAIHVGTHIRLPDAYDHTPWLRSIANTSPHHRIEQETLLFTDTPQTAETALAQGGIDLVAADLTQLLGAFNGKTIMLADASSVTLSTATATIKRHPLSQVERLLLTLSHPSTAYLLLIAGLSGVLVAMKCPGYFVPGIIGGLCLIVAILGLATLPVTIIGIALIIVGTGLLSMEHQHAHYGGFVMGGAAYVCFLLSAFFFIDRSLMIMSISRSLLIPAVLAITSMVLFLIGMTRYTLGRKTAGTQELIGATGISVSSINPFGTVRIHGEIWQARSTIAIPKGVDVRVKAANRLELEVEPKVKKA